MIEVVKKSVSRTGMCSLGWKLGYGYIRRKQTVVNDVWCVTKDGKVIAECRSKQIAVDIKNVMTIKENKDKP